MRIVGIVVLYYPGRDLSTNINSYIRYVDKLILWDNTPREDGESFSLPEIAGYDKITFMGVGYNVGLGTALNAGADYALENKFTHLLTMDQDSNFNGNDFEAYLEAIRAQGENSRVIFSVNYFLKSHRSPLYPISDSVDRVLSAMTSGSMYPVFLFDELGRFKEDLFVWGIDSEFCWRASRKGISTICFKNVLLQHDLGCQKKKRKLFGKEVFPNEYSPDRTYYNVRNGIILHRLYPEYINLRAHLRYHLYKRIVFVLLYENMKRKKWKALWDGYRDGKDGKLGKRGSKH